MDDAARTGPAGSGLGRRRFLTTVAATATLSAVPWWAGAQGPTRGGVLKVIGLEPPTFDVHATTSCRTQLFSSLVRRTLFKFVNGARYGPLDFTRVPDLALRASVSPDGKVYSILLRPGVRWESRPPLNGRELIASDVKYSMERALRRSPRASTLGPVEKIEAPEKHVVRVTLAHPFVAFLHNLAEPWNAVVPPEIDDRTGEGKAAESLIGCGPFVLERYEPGVKAVFTRSATYYQPRLPYLDKVEWLFIKDRSTQLSLFRAGQVDLPFPDGRVAHSEVAALQRSNPGYPIVPWDWLGARTLAMRTDRPPFNDVRVRRALSLALDRKAWVTQHLEGQGHEDEGPVPSSMRQWTLPGKDLGEGARYLDHDPALARTLLAEAGFGGGLKVKCTSCQDLGAELGEDLERLAASLRAVGVELQVVNEDYAQYIRGSALGKFDEASWGPSPTFTEVDGYLYTFLRSGQPGNRSHVLDPGLDAMLEAQRRAPSRTSRHRIIADIQRRAAAQVYYLYPPYPKNVSSWTPRVKNFGPKSSLDHGAQLEVVWLDRA